MFTLHHKIHVFIKEGQAFGKTLHFLMRFIRDKMFDSLISLERGQISSKVSILHKHHDTAILATKSITTNNDVWL